MIEQLITKVFKERNESHARHWSTNSFAQHEALGEFYEEVIDILDKYIEAYIGTFGKTFEIPDDNEQIAKSIRENLVWVNDNRSKLANDVPALENILDELAGLHMRTLFKLENLR
jgi:DNA-binding ferritin-like protein